MKGSPAKLGTIQGTSGHTSALKTAMDDTLAKGRAQQDASPAPFLGGLVKKVAGKFSKVKDAITKVKKIGGKKMTVSGGAKDTSDPTKQSRNKAGKKVDLRAAKRKGRINRREEKYKEQLERAGESREDRLARRKDRNEKWGNVVDQVFNPEEARTTARLKSQQASQERVAKEKTRGAEEVAKTQAGADVDVAKMRYPKDTSGSTDTEKRAQSKGKIKCNQKVSINPYKSDF